MSEMQWDALQRDVLEAMGFVLYDVQVPMSKPKPAVVENAADLAAPPLLRALARAAHVHVAQLPALPPIETLRTPQAKRAVWPQLRALRKAARA